jgi:Protein of unknown function DUF262
VATEPTPTNYVTLDLLAWYEQGNLILSPKFQRRLVWQPAARSYFIDTLLRGFPVPPIHIRLLNDPIRGAVREVVDGQQRMRTLFDFISGKLRLSRLPGSPWAGLTFSQLSQEHREALQMYRFHVYQYQNVSDQVILEIFARINTYSVILNAQELRNGKYFGYFKSLVYQLGLDYLAFWRAAAIFTERGIARMQEAELTSELLILQLDGIQDKKNSIDEFYSRLDLEWGEEPVTWQATRQTIRGQRPLEWMSSQIAKERFSETMTAVNDSVGEILAESAFSRTPLFYTLYGVVYHRLYGIPGVGLETPRSPLRLDDALRLREAVEVLSAVLAESPGDDENRVPSKYRSFVIASARQTDNIGPRQRRLETLWELAGLARQS